MSRPAQPFTAEVVERPEGAWVAIWSRLLPAEPVPGPAEAATYVKADDAQALAKARAEAVAHAQAKLQTWNRFWSLGQHSTPEKEQWYARRAAREAELEAAAAAEEAALTSDEKAERDAEEAASYAAWEAEKEAERDARSATAAAAWDARLDALGGPGTAAAHRAALEAHNARVREEDALILAEIAEAERLERELDEVYGMEEEPQAANGHLNGAEVAFRPPERVTPVSEPEEDPEARRERQRAENATIGDEEPGSFNMPNWKLEEFLAYCFALDTDKPSVAYVHLGRVSVRLMPTFIENFNHCTTLVGKKQMATTALWRKAKERQFLAGATHSVGFPVIMEDGRLHNGQRVINTWAPKPLVEVYHPGLKDFTQHLGFIFRDRADEVVQWLAHCEQKPWELPHQGWLSICETHGIGRNWIASALTRVWAGEVAASLDMGALVGGAFNNRISGKRLAVVDEINLSGNANARHTIMAKRRQLMTEEVRRINGKFAIEHDEINVLRWLVFSNHADAMPIDAEDRRDEVVFGPKEPKALSYYTHLYGLLKDPRFIQAVRWYLAKLDIGGYNAGKRATLTGDKKRAIKASRSTLTNNVADWIEEHPERTFATARDMSWGDEGSFRTDNFAQQWKHVVHELGLMEVRCGGQRKHALGGSRSRKVFMVRPPVGWGITLAEDGLVDLDYADYERMLVEVKGDETPMPGK